MFSSVLGMISLAVAETLLHQSGALTKEPILATVFGGLLLGSGLVVQTVALSIE